jgi:hypothetical protein
MPTADMCADVVSFCIEQNGDSVCISLELTKCVRCASTTKDTSNYKWWLRVLKETAFILLSFCTRSELSEVQKIRSRSLDSDTVIKKVKVSHNRPTWPKARIFLMFGTTRVVGRYPFAPAAFTPGEISGTNFQRLSQPQGTWFRR